MVKNQKKILALVLSLIMALSMPFSVFAEAGNGTNAGTTNQTTGAENAIVSQPEDAAVYLNDTASFTVEVTGKVKSYQWQYSKNGKKWANVSSWNGGKKATMSIVASKAYEDALFRCVITMKKGKNLTSDTARLTIMEEAVTYPAAEFKTEESDDLSVSVSAPEGAFPDGTTMTVSEVTVDEAQALIDASDFAGAEVLAAKDISFDYDGEEIQPNEAVLVSMNIADIEGIESLEEITVYHISDDGEVSVVTLDESSTLETLVFKADGFSTFTVTGNNRTVTIHHGIMSGSTFVEFGTNGLPESSNSNYPRTLAASGYNNNAYAYLIYDFPGYSYKETHLTTATGTEIYPIIRANGNNNNSRQWQSTTNGSNWSAIDNNANIYVIYDKTSISHGITPEESSGGDTPSVPEDYKPDITKNISGMGDDGTYDITLSVVGEQNEIQTQVKARVIVVFDMSYSMRYTFSGSGTNNNERLNAAKTAVSEMADKLLNKKDNNGNPVELVEMGLITFHQYASVRQFGNSYFTTSYSTFNSAVSGLQADDTAFGTNWEHALTLANYLEASPNSKTYVVFVSDGDPTYRISRGNFTDAQIRSEAYNALLNYSISSRDIMNHRVFQFGHCSIDENYIPNDFAPAVEVGKAITNSEQGNKTMYAVGLSQDAARMQSFATQTGAKYYAGDDPDTFAAAISSIANAISSELDLSNVTINDGVTSMSEVETSTDALIGTTGNFTYTQAYPMTLNGSNYTYTDGETTYTVPASSVPSSIEDEATYNGHRIFNRKDKNGVNIWYIEYPWDEEDTPKAQLTESNSVIWSTGSYSLTDGVVYSVTFTVWPSQEAYDLIADLDNGIRTVSSNDANTGLSNLQRQQLIVTVNGSDYEFSNGAWTGGLTSAQLQTLIDQADPDNVSYSMKTNTGLNATYSYGGANGQADYSESYENGRMSLDDTSIKIKKTWNNYLDARDASGVILTITRDGQNYTDINMGEPTEVTTTDGGKQWIQTPDTDLYISLGVLSVTGNDIIVRETGYDYTVIEPEYFSYRWDLSADIYHPMVINGVTVVLIKVQNTTGLPSTVTGLEENKAVTVDDLTYYKFNNTLYVTKPGENLLEATNDRRSNLMINKTVADTDAPEEDLFPLQITITNPNAPLPGTEGYNYWYHASWFFVSTTANDRNTIVFDGVVVSDNVTPEISELRTDNTHISNIVPHEADGTYPYDYITYDYDGTPNVVKAVDLEKHTGSEEVNGQTVSYEYYSYYTGFYWFDNGATATVSIRDGWYINFNNMGRDTVYTIVEPTASMPDGYTFDVATSSATNIQNLTVTPAEIDGFTAEGTIDRPNSDYSVTYKNNYEGVYYVYHSSDNTVVRFPMAIDGKVVETFDIAIMTKDGSLYGGYYTNYSGKSSGFAAADLDYVDNESADTGEGAKPYEGDKETWKNSEAYTVNGFRAVPVRGTTYYLKEVPADKYLRPYLHFTYYRNEAQTIGNAWLISDTDDLNYSESGFVIITSDKKAAWASSLTIQTTNPADSSSVKLTPTRVFKAKGYLTYLEVIDNTNDANESPADSAMTPLLKDGDNVEQYWITLDGLHVTGTLKRTYSGLTGKATEVDRENIETQSTITEVETSNP